MKKLFLFLLLVLQSIAVFSQKYDSKSTYSEGLAAVRWEGLWGYVDQEDNLVINYAFKKAESFSNGAARVLYNDKWIYIDKSGKVLSDSEVAKLNKRKSETYSSNLARNSQSPKSQTSSTSVAKNTTGYSSSGASTGTKYSSSQKTQTSSPSVAKNTNSTYSSKTSTTAKNTTNTGNKTYQQTNSRYEIIDQKLIKERDGFCWIKITAKNLDAWNKGKLRYVTGAKDKNGNVLIPVSFDYDYIEYSNEDNDGIPPFFIINEGGVYGAYSIKGTVILPPRFSWVEYDPWSDVIVILNSKGEWKSTGFSIRKNGDDYYSNKGIVSNSEFYTPPKPLITQQSSSPSKTNYSSNSYSSSSNTYSSSNNPHSSSSNTSISNDNESDALLGIGLLAAGVAAFVDFLSDEKQEQEDITKAAKTEPAPKSKNNVEIIGTNLSNSWVHTPEFSIRNKNSYDVVVTIDYRYSTGPWHHSKHCYTVMAGKLQTFKIYDAGGSLEDIRINSVR